MVGDIVFWASVEEYHKHSGLEPNHRKGVTRTVTQRVRISVHEFEEHRLWDCNSCPGLMVWFVFCVDSMQREPIFFDELTSPINESPYSMEEVEFDWFWFSSLNYQEDIFFK